MTKQPEPENGTSALPVADLREMARHAGEAAGLMRVLANRNRLMVLCILAEGETSVGELNRRVPLSPSALSQHLAVLRREGLVDTRREAQTIHYALREGPALEIISKLHSIYCGNHGRVLSKRGDHHANRKR